MLSPGCLDPLPRTSPTQRFIPINLPPPGFPEHIYQGPEGHHNGWLSTSSSSRSSESTDEPAMPPSPTPSIESLPPPTKNSHTFAELDHPVETTPQPLEEEPAP